MNDEVKDVIEQPGPKLNREQRRAKERMDRKAAKKSSGKGLTLTPENASALLMETVTVNRWDAVNRVLTALFAEDIGGTTMRLQGIGGATGVITKEALEAAGATAIQAGIMLPQTGADGEPVAAEDGAPVTEEEAATRGGLLLVRTETEEEAEATEDGAEALADGGFHDIGGEG